MTELIVTFCDICNQNQSMSEPYNWVICNAKFAIDNFDWSRKQSKQGFFLHICPKCSEVSNDQRK